MPPIARLSPLLLLLGCMPPHGTNGPTIADPPSGTGACFEVNITDGIQDGAELNTLFNCFNQYGAFDPLAPTVAYMCTSPEAQALVDATNGTFAEFDVVAGLETTARLLDSPEAPLSTALDLYVESYDVGLLPPTLGVALEGAQAMLACEQSADPAACSVPRFLRRVIDTDIPDQVGVVFDAVSASQTDAQVEATLLDVAGLLYDTSTLCTECGNGENLLLDLGAFLIDPVPLEDGTDGPSRLEQLLPTVIYLLDEDLDENGVRDPETLVESLVRHLNPKWLDGSLQQVPGILLHLYTYDASGAYVGWEGEGVLDQLLAATAPLTGDMDLLDETFTLPGSTESTTILELALDTLDSLYLDGADVEGMVTTMNDLVNNQLCSGESSASSAMCQMAEDMLPPLTAAVQTGIGDILLPAVYAIHQQADVHVLLDAARLLLEWDLLTRTEFITRETLERGMLDDTLAMYPVFVDADLGRLSPEGVAALDLVGWALNPWVYDEATQARLTPATFALPLMRRMLHPTNPGANLDFLMGTAGRLLSDPTSGLYVPTLLDLMDAVQAAMGEVDVDMTDLATRLLDNEVLWLNGLTLGADPTLIGLLTPAEGVEGPSWYLYDLITRGVVGDILTYTGGLLDFLTDQGLLDPYATDSGQVP